MAGWAIGSELGDELAVFLQKQVGVIYVYKFVVRVLMKLREGNGMPKVTAVFRMISSLTLLVSLAYSEEGPVLKTIATGTYSLVLPQGYRPGSKYPVHIVLHGAGDSCSNFAMWWAEAIGSDALTILKRWGKATPSPRKSPYRP